MIPRSVPISHSSVDCRLVAWTQTSAAGVGLDALADAVRARRSGLARNDFRGSRVDTWIGRVGAVDAFSWGPDDGPWASRNNALLRVGLAQDGFFGRVAEALARFGADRVGVAMGTSTSSIGRTEEAYAVLEDDRFAERFRQPRVHNPGSPGLYAAQLLRATGPQLTLSTACSSSAKVFATGWRWLQAGLVDAVVVGGVDSLCHSVLAGFQSLELTSPAPCRPYDAGRDGINIGEAAGFALLVRAEDAPNAPVRLAGYGESSDAFHMSQPPADGEGARRAMEAALARAGLGGEDIGYVNLHGTATRANDAAEAEAIAAVLPGDVVASSTKGWTGHTLGAAGIVEAVVAIEALQRGLLPGTLNLEAPDASLAIRAARDNVERRVEHVLTNSFGFGGNNCSLVFSRAA